MENARAIQQERFKTKGLFCNAQMHGKLIKEYCLLNTQAKELMRMAISELSLSARAYDKILKVARTIADLSQEEIISAEHVAEAIQYRSLDKQLN